MNVYFIGGSPCSGKSTIAEILSKKYDLHYFKVDDFLEKYTKMGASKGYEICKKQEYMNAEEIWMREPWLQCNEEFAFYEEIFEFVMSDLEKINEKGIITEGAAYFPKLMKKLGVSRDKYLAITPTKDFQIEHYRQREWVPFVLEGCSDKEKAFSNWMNRDALFALEVQRQCNEEQYVSIINDGSSNIDEMVERVATYFGLGENIILEHLTHENYKHACEINRDDIPEEWVDTAATIMDINDYGLENNLIGHTFLARIGDKYIGLIMVGEALPWDTDPIEMKGVPFYRLMGFVVDKEYRNRGLGSVIMEKGIEQVYQEFGRRSLALGVHRENTQAGRFYERHGFRKTGVFEGDDEYYLRLI